MNDETIRMMHRWRVELTAFHQLTARRGEFDTVSAQNLLNEANDIFERVLRESNY